MLTPIESVCSFNQAGKEVKNAGKGRPAVIIEVDKIFSMVMAGQTYEEIAKIVGVSKSSIKRKCKELGINNKKTNQRNKNIMVRLIKEGKSDIEISRELNYHVDTIRSWRNEMNLAPPLGHGGARKGSGRKANKATYNEFYYMKEQQYYDSLCNSMEVRIKTGIGMNGSDWLKWASSAYELTKNKTSYKCKNWSPGMPRYIPTAGELLDNKDESTMTETEKLMQNDNILSGGNRKSGKGNATLNTVLAAQKGY